MKFSHLAGDTGLDLVNTVDWRLSPQERGDRLAGYADVVDWCVEARLLASDRGDALAALAHDDPAGAERERVRVVTLREALYATLFHADQVAAQSVADEYRDALAAARLEPGPGGWTWQEDMGLSTPRHVIARRLAELVQRDDLDRLHQCEDARCGWVFLDTSPRRNRRWCATSDCGDRNRARAYYARRKAAGGA